MRNVIPSHDAERTRKEVKKFNDKEFEVERPSVLTTGDIHRGDRVFIRTESGSRYMFRWSKSAGEIKIYKEEAEGFKQGYILHNEGKIAEVGKSSKFTLRMPKGTGQSYSTYSITPVMEIEIVRGLDNEVETGRPGGAMMGGILAESLRKSFREKPSSDEDDGKDFFDKFS